MTQLDTDQFTDVVAAARKRVTNHPDTWSQSSWLHIGHAWDGHWEQISDDELVNDMITVGTDVEAWLACNTTACIAGHLVAAALELGYLDQDEMVTSQIDVEDAALDLFNGHDMPDNLFWHAKPYSEIEAWMDQVVGDGVTS